jgi:hypothetical protein
MPRRTRPAEVVDFRGTPRRLSSGRIEATTLDRPSLDVISRSEHGPRHRPRLTKSSISLEQGVRMRRSVSAVVAALFPFAALGQVPVWPPGAAPGGTYSVDPSEQTLIVQRLVLPDNFTIKVPPGLKLKWTVDVLEIGTDATIDLSAPADKPPKPPRAADAVGQPAWGQKGRPGADGEVGARGAAGSALELNVHTLGKVGSLWVQTSGGAGADGGDGGRGGLGGGNSCGFQGEPRTDSGEGGNGGSGGAGGIGGDTSSVVIRIRNAPASRVTSPACATTCGAASRPPAATGANGVIAVWGAPGCGGAPGAPGAGGPSDRSRCPRNCGFLLGSVGCRGPGSTGAAAAQGAAGACGPAKIEFLAAQ